MAGKQKYRIIGRRGIGIFQAGQIVDEDDLAGVNIDALLAGGHIVVEKKVESPKTARVEEE